MTYSATYALCIYDAYCCWNCIYTSIYITVLFKITIQLKNHQKLHWTIMKTTLQSLKIGPVLSWYIFYIKWANERGNDRVAAVPQVLKPKYCSDVHSILSSTKIEQFYLEIYFESICKAVTKCNRSAVNDIFIFLGSFDFFWLFNNFFWMFKIVWIRFRIGKVAKKIGNIWKNLKLFLWNVWI